MTVEEEYKEIMIRKKLKEEDRRERREKVQAKLKSIRKVAGHAIRYVAASVAAMAIPTGFILWGTQAQSPLAQGLLAAGAVVGTIAAVPIAGEVNEFLRDRGL